MFIPTSFGAKSEFYISRLVYSVIPYLDKNFCAPDWTAKKPQHGSGANNCYFETDISGPQQCNIPHSYRNWKSIDARILMSVCTRSPTRTDCKEGERGILQGRERGSPRKGKWSCSSQSFFRLTYVKKNLLFSFVTLF